VNHYNNEQKYNSLKIQTITYVLNYFSKIDHFPNIFFNFNFAFLHLCWI